jgi:hypothetical protein
MECRDVERQILRLPSHLFDNAIFGQKANTSVGVGTSLILNRVNFHGPISRNIL